MYIPSVYENHAQVHFSVIGDTSILQVGDVRVWFEFAGSTEWGQEDDISVVARQAPGGTLTVFTTPSGYELLLVYMEKISMMVSCSSALRIDHNCTCVVFY